MFLNNKYTKLYYNIIDKTIKREHIKVSGDLFQQHHIVPKSLGGSNENCNLVYLTYKEHRVCHRLLTKMVTGEAKYKMIAALQFFDSKHGALTIAYANSFKTAETFKKAVATRKRRGSYKTGSENIFASDELRILVSRRMKENNPMKDPIQRERMKLKNNNPKTKPINVNGQLFPSINAAARHFGVSRPIFIRDFTYEFAA